MSDAVTLEAYTKVFPISDAERAREDALRDRFAGFWGSASGEPRDVYDAFIAGCPMREGVSLTLIDEGGGRGWRVDPAMAASGKAILFLHGGGYVQGSATAYRGFVSQIVARAGVPALVIDYPLAPEARAPAALHAALAGWGLLVAQGFERIAVVGDSAGGGLTLTTLAELAARGDGPKPVAGVAFSPWTDLAFTGGSMRASEIFDPLISYEYLQDCARKYSGNAVSFDPQISPLFGDHQSLPPLLIQVGTDERLLDDSRQYAAAVAEAGVPVELELWEGMHHVFQLDVSHLESSRRALDNAARFLADAFKR